jgi:hypothetical protein
MSPSNGTYCFGVVLISCARGSILIDRSRASGWVGVYAFDLAMKLWFHS